MPGFRSSLITATLVLLIGTNLALAEAPPFTGYCQRMQQEIQGKKHGFLSGNVTYYVGGFHASWELKEHETIGLTHPFHHDLRSRGVGLVRSRGKGHDDTGLGNDFSGWEFYKDTRIQDSRLRSVASDSTTRFRDCERRYSITFNLAIPSNQGRKGREGSYRTKFADTTDAMS